MFDNIKALFQAPASALNVISIKGPLDYSELPQGFFRVETASGNQSLGFNCPSFLSWEVGETVVYGGQRIKLDVPRESLPLVKLNFKSYSSGVQHIGTHGVLDTDNMPGEWNGEPGWDGTTPRDGIEYA